MEIVLLIMLLLVGAAFGMRVMRLLGFVFDGFAEELAFSIALGLGLIGYLVFLMGLAGLIYAWALSVVLIIIALLTQRELLQIVKSICPSLRGAKRRSNLRAHVSGDCFALWARPPAVHGDWRAGNDGFWLLLIAAVCAGTLIGACAPPTGNDSLAYRLPDVKAFVEAHRLVHLRYTMSSLWPHLMEMLFTLGMAVKSDILAKLIAWSFGPLGALFIYVFARRYFSRTATLISALVFLTTPAIFTQMTCVYVDIPLSVYGFASLFALIKFIENRDIRWAALAGAFCGLVLSVKYTGVLAVFALGCAIMWLIVLYRNERKMLFAAIALFAVFIFVFSFAWYLRAFLITGNPVYPFRPEFFGGHGWIRDFDRHIGGNFSPAAVLTAPWSLTMHPERHGGESAGVMYLLFLPLLFFTDRRKSAGVSAYLWIYCLAYLPVWQYMAGWNVRFLYPVFFPLAVLAGSGISAVAGDRGLFGRAVKAVFAGLCVFYIAHLTYNVSDKTAVAFGMESRQDYLARTERTYKMAEYINANLPMHETVLYVGEIHVYYVNRPFIHLGVLMLEDNIPFEEIRSIKFLDELKKRGINYVLYSPREGWSYEWMDFLMKSRKPLHEYGFTDRDDRHFELRLYRINENTG